jgi:hypothetical protein
MNYHVPVTTSLLPWEHFVGSRASRDRPLKATLLSQRLQLAREIFDLPNFLQDIISASLEQAENFAMNA